ncbi:hypothetical protein G210_5856 [Candida maltosa Xu316]|uniref:Uncharacterized protein n=1 Tax=Candida maltosa (strain Xu316) TaxID=1245528 RepID=M3HPH1_CANMX|nr:hypothetical protein G210_5856 [Candida maltosa Xu316]
MTQDNPADIADAYKQLTAAEKQAENLEKWLDSFEAKLDSLLQETEDVQKSSTTETQPKEETK